VANGEAVDVRFSPAIEDYLKTIYLLELEHGQVSTCLLAEQLRFTPASVTGMLQKLAKLDLVRYMPYHGAVLTASGHRVALEVVRHHRLLELYLVETLGYRWDDAHAEADVLEHVISERLEARIAERLGHPTSDPYGYPIPLPDLTLPPGVAQPLEGFPLDHPATIVRVLDQDSAHLRYLEALGLMPGAWVTVRERAPFDGPLTLDVGNSVHALDRSMARTITVCSAASTDDTLR
jgi:DtxR family transcriptional regulator, Mn-dependent transcriptional regulator